MTLTRVRKVRTATAAAGTVLRAADYARVSQDKRKGRSVGEQHELSVGVITQNAWDHVGSYVDNDKGASRTSKGSRADWERLMGDIRAGLIDILVVWEISRSTRDRKVWAALFEACIDNDVKICVDGKVHDLDDPDDAFMLDLGIGLGVREAAMTRKRVLRTLKANADEGRPHGQTPFGFKRLYDPESGLLDKQILDPGKAAVVREIADHILAGRSVKSIINDLNSRGIPSPNGGMWGRSTIRAILTAAATAGLRQHNGEITRKGWPEIITEEELYYFRAMFADETRRKNRDSAVKHLMSGLGFCAVCDAPLQPVRPNNSPIYRCGATVHTAAREAQFDAVVLDWIVDRISRSENRSDILNNADSADALIAAQLELDALENRLQEFLVASISGSISAESFSRIEAGLAPQISAAKEKVVNAKRATPASLAKLIQSDDVLATWGGLSLLDRRAAIRGLGPFYLTMAKGKGPWPLDPLRVIPPWRPDLLAISRARGGGWIG